MDIYPQDLGQSRQLILMQRRATGMFTNGAASTPSPVPTGGRLGWLGQQWARGTALPPRIAAATLDAMRPAGFVAGLAIGSIGFWVPATAAATSGHVVVACVMATFGMTMSATGLLIPGIWLHRLANRAVTPEEIESLQDSTRGDLEYTYLCLAADVARQSLAPDTASGVRSALRALGDAIDRLPSMAPPRADATALRIEAEQVGTQAGSEQDSVVAASQRRRAEALTRSARAAERSDRLLRRTTALREELTAQAEALRLGLLGFQAGEGDAAGLSELADAVQAIATEAASVSDARTELDSALSSSASIALSAPDEAPAKMISRHR